MKFSIARFLFSMYAMIVFLLLLLMVFPFALLSMLWGRVRGGNMLYRLCMLWADVWFLLVFIFIKKIKEAPLDVGRSCIYVANHISYLDTPLIMKAFRKPLRPLAKAEMGKLPIFGFIYKNATVSVERDSIGSRSVSLRRLKSFLGKGISVLVFPEGTFNETGKPLKNFYNGAFRLAIETQTPIRPVLFLDTYTRMPYSGLFTLNPGHCRVVYLPEVPVEGLSLKDADMLKLKVKSLMEVRLISYKADWIRQD
ncbi:MAG: lysophospholipid acyltransferase family protein [Niabella sp.]